MTRLSDMKRAAEPYGITLTTPKSGSHWKFEKPGHRPYPVPAHNGIRTEIGKAYVKGFCRAFLVDPDEFSSKL